MSNMQLCVMRGQSSQCVRDRKRFMAFRHELYRNDPYYSPTAEFTFEMLMNQTTAFARRCLMEPVFVSDTSDRILAEALIIRYEADDFAQISFFEALKNQRLAADLIVSYAKSFAARNGCQKVYVGLNGHLSYGVGLSVDMKAPNTFDSTYTKPYYRDYFDAYPCHMLTAYTSGVSDAAAHLPDIHTRGAYRIRYVEFSRFREECELFRDLCNRTIGTTFLYTQTEQNHFYELLDPMRFFLKKENILFAYHGDTPVGFLFWHPDYNEILPKGKQVSVGTIAIRYLLYRNNIRKVKLNSMGVLPEHRGIATLLLLKEMQKHLGGYERIETNFVWDNNVNSTLLNRDVLGGTARKFCVYEVNI